MVLRSINNVQSAAKILMLQGEIMTEVKPALSPYITIDGICYTEISNTAIENIAPGQYINNKGIVYNSASRKLIHPCPNGKDGYMYTHVYRLDGSKVQIGVHRLLMLVFMYNPNYKELQINHKDLNKQNNALSNLEWCTPQENITHAFINDAVVYGESHGMSKLTEKEVEEICSIFEKGLYRGIFTDLANRYNVDVNTIYDISKGKSWTRVSSKYNINYDEKIFTFTPDQTVHEICKALSGKRYRGQLTDLANKFGIGLCTVYDIAHGNAFSEISSLYNIDYNWTPNTLTEEDVEKICYRLKNDKHYGLMAEIARDYEVSYGTISAIAHHRIWTDISDKYDLP